MNIHDIKEDVKITLWDYVDRILSYFFPEDNESKVTIELKPPRLSK